MTMHVWMTPTEQQLGPSGISQVIKAYKKYMPRLGVEFVDTKEFADLTVSHAGTYPNADVLMCHGLHWTQTYSGAPNWEHHTNKHVIKGIRNAIEVTVPSKWVAKTFERDMRFSPHIIGHGIDVEEWSHTYLKKGYVLWNKNRTLDVCDNSLLAALCEEFPETQFVSTFPLPKHYGSNPKNLLVTDLLDHGLL